MMPILGCKTRSSRLQRITPYPQGAGPLSLSSALTSLSHSPDRLKPDWWRFLTGGLGRVGEPRVEPAGVPPLGVVVRSKTGPSYMPLGTACRSAICMRCREMACQPSFIQQFRAYLCGQRSRGTIMTKVPQGRHKQKAQYRCHS